MVRHFILSSQTFTTDELIESHLLMGQNSDELTSFLNYYNSKTANTDLLDDYHEYIYMYNGTIEWSYLKFLCFRFLKCNNLMFLSSNQMDGWIYYYHRQHKTMVSQNSVLILVQTKKYKKCPGWKGKQHLSKIVCYLTHGLSGAGSYLFPTWFGVSLYESGHVDI